MGELLTDHVLHHSQGIARIVCSISEDPLRRIYMRVTYRKSVQVDMMGALKLDVHVIDCPWGEVALASSLSFRLLYVFKSPHSALFRSMSPNAGTSFAPLRRRNWRVQGANEEKLLEFLKVNPAVRRLL